jgi:lysophospholipid acyltransferase (LPLAT)-like uncharacterized protein
MSAAKRIIRSDLGRRILCWLVARYIRIVWLTSRWHTEGREHPETFWSQGRPFILAFWHGRLLMAPKAWPATASMNMLISGHADGRIIADAIAHFGLKTIEGSRSKGGLAALRAMVRALGSGQNIGVTPDGPRGPLMRVSPGIIAAAKLSQAPIIPLSFATRNRLILGSWDRFHVALPFTRGVFLWGEPLSVPRDADPAHLEDLRLDLERRMNDLTAAADRACGHAPVEPAPPEPVFISGLGAASG